MDHYVVERLFQSVLDGGSTLPILTPALVGLAWLQAQLPWSVRVELEIVARDFLSGSDISQRRGLDWWVLLRQNARVGRQRVVEETRMVPTQYEVSVEFSDERKPARVITGHRR